MSQKVGTPVHAQSSETSEASQEPSDPAAVRASAQDSPSAIAKSAAECFSTQLRNYLNRRLRGPQEVQDCAQEVYLRLLRINPDLRVANTLAFVLSVAKHVVADHLMAANRDAQRFVPAPDTWDDDEDVLDLRHGSLEDALNVRQELEQALGEIPPLYATILVLHKRDGMSYEEVAAELALSVHTVHKYIDRARALLRMRRWEPSK